MSSPWDLSRNSSNSQFLTFKTTVSSNFRKIYASTSCRRTFTPESSYTNASSADRRKAVSPVTSPKNSNHIWCVHIRRNSALAERRPPLSPAFTSLTTTTTTRTSSRPTQWIDKLPRRRRKFYLAFVALFLYEDEPTLSTAYLHPVYFAGLIAVPSLTTARKGTIERQRSRRYSRCCNTRSLMVQTPGA